MRDKTQEEKEQINQLAESIFLDSVSIENNFKPMRYVDLQNEMESRGYRLSVGYIAKISKAMGWDEKVKNKAKNLSNIKVAKVIASEKEVNALKNIEKTIIDSSQVLAEYVARVKENGYLDKENVELVLKINVACVGLLNKPLEKQDTDQEVVKIKTQDLLNKAKNMSDDEIIEGEIE